VKLRFAISGLLSAALVAGVGTASEPSSERFLVRTFEGHREFIVQFPDAGESAAWRDAADLADKDGRVPQAIGGFDLTAKVLLRPLNEAALDEFVASHAGAKAYALDASPGFFAVEFPSVREAIAAAETLAGDARLADVHVDVGQPWTTRVPSDPRFTLEWNVFNTLDPLFDANIEPVWNAGYTGAGVTIGIVELRWQRNHPDLAPNFNATASQNLGASDSAHATSCAGIIGAVANNGMFGAGVAYGGQISTQVIATGDQAKADALAFRNDLNHIKSNSWGPLDNGLVTSWGPTIRAAVENAIATGRGGLGEIFVWAGGNGHPSNDRCDYDPYASSRFTICVGAINDRDEHPAYSENGSSLTIVAQSDGDGGRTIYSTSSNNGETLFFGGTSAACPLTAGSIALLLQANPGLTWRDVQHILIRSARQCDPTNPSWLLNGAGRRVSYEYGYGALDAAAALALALDWNTAPPEVAVDTGVQNVATVVPDADAIGLTQTVNVGQNIRVESVELFVNATTSFVGDLRITLTSPSGTESRLANQRGDSQDNYVDYRFTSRRHWDEESAGTWSVNIADLGAGVTATWNNYRIVLHGRAVCVGDVNDDFAVDLTDLAALLITFGLCEGQPGFNAAADFDDSTCVDLTDLASLLTVFGTACP
jgi:subtilisin-like proprotein convertase family protein